MNASIPVIADPKVTRHILSAFHLRASKRLGQNFLVDAGVVRAIVDAADLSPADTVLEIGPGIGTLTQGLAESGARRCCRAGQKTSCRPRRDTEGL